MTREVWVEVSELWSWFGRADLTPTMAVVGTRCRQLHVKKPVGFESGRVDYPRLMVFGRSRDTIEWWIIEQEPFEGDPIDALAAN